MAPPPADPFSDPDLPHRFRDKVAIVTGAAQGIGRATARRLGAEGAAVWCADVNGEGAAGTAKEIADHGGTAQASAIDVTDAAACQALVAEVVDAFGGLDVLCNIAGIGHFAKDEDETPEWWNRILGVNLTGTYFMSQAALPHLLDSGHGSVVNITSAMGRFRDRGYVAYGTAKAALAHMTRLLAADCAPKVRVNGVAPGSIATSALDIVVNSEPLHQEMVAKTPLRRLGDADDIALAVLYLASDAASYVTGAVWLVDGGITPAKGAVGLRVSRATSTPPPPTIDLHHSFDGTRNKELVKIP